MTSVALDERAAHGVGAALAGPLARMWANGAGPSHSRIESVMAAAGLDPEAIQGTKEARVRRALQTVDPSHARQLVTDLVELLADDNSFSAESDTQAGVIARLRAALSTHGGQLAHGGALMWSGSNFVPDSSPSSAPTVRAEPPLSNHAEVRGRVERVGAMASAPTIFLVHGHEESTRNAVEIHLRRWIGGADIVVLDRKASAGNTLVEKFEKHADTASFAIVLATPDDEGRVKDGSGALQPRARQNVVFEMGYFFAKLGRGKVVIMDGGVEPGSADEVAPLGGS